MAFAGPANELEQQAAVEFYARAISLALGGDRRERKQLTGEVALAEDWRSEREEGDECCDEYAWGRDLKASCVPEEVLAAFMVSECFDGSGPAGLRGDDIPLAARIVSVAEHWAALTAKRSPKLTQGEALGDLDASAGSRYDPEVVKAVHLAVERGYVG